MGNFTARTRLRGEVAYYDANWETIKQGNKVTRRVMFMNGPHVGNTYPESMCAIAKNDKYLLGRK